MGACCSNKEVIMFYFRLCMLMMRYSCVTAQAWFFLHLSQQKQTWFWMAFYQSTRWETIFLQFLLYLFRLETILSKVNIFHWLVTHPTVQAHVFYFLSEAKQKKKYLRRLFCVTWPENACLVILLSNLL